MLIKSRLSLFRMLSKLLKQESSFCGEVVGSEGEPIFYLLKGFAVIECVNPIV